MEPEEAEFVTSYIIFASVIFCGLMLTICLTMLGIAVYRKKKETKFTIHGKEKERQNGQHTTRGKW